MSGNHALNKGNVYGTLLCEFALIILLNLVSLPIFADNGRNCDDIPKEKIESILIGMNISTVQIVGITQSPLNGICEVEVIDKGKVGIFYADNTLEHVLFGTLFETKNMTNLTANNARISQGKRKIDLASITLNEELVMGEKNAAKKVIVFTDPD